MEGIHAKRENSVKLALRGIVWVVFRVLAAYR